MNSENEESVPEHRLKAWWTAWRIRLTSQRYFTAYFFLSAVCIVLTFLIYAQVYVVRPMRQETTRMGKVYAFMHSVATLDKIEVKGFYVDVIFDMLRNPNFPVVITDEQGEPRYWKAVAVADDAERTSKNLGELREIARQLDLENDPLPFEFPGTEWGPDNQPILGIPEIWQLHWGESDLEKRLRWLPFVALGVTVLFTGVGYLGFRSIKNNEQRSIWVGMARETAHQLGTPLSSLYGWLEILKAEADDIGDGEVGERLKNILNEMDRDTGRLNKITSRFSLIGSTPELRMDNVQEVVSETAGYLRARLPSNVKIMEAMDGATTIPLNRELLGWAFENLFKNAADAMESGEGRIDVASRIDNEAHQVVIEVQDTGKGIPAHMFKQVFLPGISTKKRGWGLGLAFVRRIVEEYHGGKIWIKESAPDQGTTFVISLPLTPVEAEQAG